MKAIVDPPAEVREHVDIASLTKQAEAAHVKVQEADGEALEARKRVGDILWKIKKTVGHGFWKRWVKDNLDFNYRSAARYMRISLHWEAIQKNVSDSSQSGDSLGIKSSSAALEFVKKKDGDGRSSKKKSHTIPPELQKHADTMKAMNAQFGIKASPNAVLSLMLEMGITEAAILKALQKTAKTHAS